MRGPSKVFFDPSGRRWRRVKRSTLLGVGLFLGLLAISWGPVHSSPANGRPEGPMPPLGSVDDAPSIGDGPLVRLVRIESRGANAVALDPLTGSKVATLTAAEAQSVGGRPYAVYRYGYDAGVHRTIALTFDDGPDPTWTPQILDLLSQNKVPATFFVVGTEVVRNRTITERAVREGHTVANHTMTHPSLTV